MAPGSIFIIIFSDLYIKNTKNTLLQFIYFQVLVIFYIYIYQISPLQVTVKGLTTPLSRWVQVFDCLCRCIYWGLVRFSYWIDTLVLNRGKYLSLLYCITLS